MADKMFSTRKVIHATPAKIWAILTDADRYPEWDPNMIRIEGNIAPGEKLKIYTKLAPERAFTPVVKEFEPERRMVWYSGMPFGLFTGERTFTLEPTDDGVIFETKEVFTGPMMRLIGSTIPDMTDVFDQFGEGLKARAEEA